MTATGVEPDTVLPAEESDNTSACEGLSPQDVCAKYFQACAVENIDLWLGTLHTELKSIPTVGAPGPFDTCSWSKGRYRVTNFKVIYNYLREVSKGIRGSDPIVTLAFQPLYGEVPGYDLRSPLGDEIELTLKNEDGEWKVLKGSF